MLLAGGALLAQSMIRLNLVDEYHFFIYPVVSAGATWFDQIESKPEMDFLGATTYENGVVGLYYKQ
jgi:dihydrofolate reductase